MDEVRKQADEKFCHECGALIRARAEICPKCGVRQPSETGKNKMTAALLAIFLVGIGAHRFYLGKTGSGVVYLLFCWTFIPLVVGLIEGLVYLGMSDQAFERKFGTT